MTDNNDNVDVAGLGERMCSNHNLTYDHREYATGDSQNERGFMGGIPTIYCKEKTIRNISIEDSYLIKINNGGD
jgi:hypothetical protein